MAVWLSREFSLPAVSASYLEDERKTLEAHDEYKSYRGKFLLSLRVENTSGKYLFLHWKEKHLELRRKSSTQPFKILEQVPELHYESWQIFETTPNGGRISRKMYLGEFTEQHILLLVSKIDLDDEEPFTLTLRNVIAHAKTDEIVGFNDHDRQMSSERFRDLLVPEVSFLVHPVKVKHPVPPPGFDNLLKSME